MMEPIDVDNIAEVDYLDDSMPGAQIGVEIRFKDGTRRFYSGAELPEVLAVLNHWTPPTA